MAYALFAINCRKGQRRKYYSLEHLCSTRGKGPVEVALVNELNTEWTTKEMEEIPSENMEDHEAQMADLCRNIWQPS